MNLLPARLVALLLANMIVVAATATAAVVTATYNAATDIPVAAASYTATGNTVNFALNFAPPVGTNLTVVNNTGAAYIVGNFGGLPQGQAVNLTYGGITYPFVANYYGGTGNDLVLEWANRRLLTWGSNSYGQLGNNSYSGSPTPVPVVMTGVLASKTVTRVSAKGASVLGLLADGNLASWGGNDYGQLGNATRTSSSVPVLVDRSGVLAGKAITAIAAGYSHSLVVCADGTLASWGYNNNGQLGNATATFGSNVATLVDTSGVLAGKTATQTLAATNHNLVLCTDGSLVTWGQNDYGQLGNGSTTNSAAPLLVNRTGVLAGRTVVALDTGTSHSIALCADGAIAVWGYGNRGTLGNGGSVESYVPVLVNASGVLAGKTVVAIAAGNAHNLALCSDGSVAAWGLGDTGQLGNNSTTNRNVPVLVDRTGVLAGKTVVAVSAAGDSSFAQCSDGTQCTWGTNTSGQLGNNTTTQSIVPVLVSNSALKTGERMLAGRLAYSNGLALVAAPSTLQNVTTLAATAITGTTTSLHGSANANGSATTVAFDYGVDTSYGNTLAATPTSVSGSADTPVAANLSGLLPGTTYHYRITATSAGGTVRGNDMSFKTTSSASLAGLVVDGSVLMPGFSSINTSYSVTVPADTGQVTVTPTASLPSATLIVNGSPVASGTASQPLSLVAGNNPISIVVTAAGGSDTQTYGVVVTRLPAVLAFNSVADIPVTAADFLATAAVATFSLNFAPTMGTNLTVVKNTGANAIQGAFTNLAQGQLAYLTYGATSYGFVADYYGGTGNDLVLHWANTRLLAWGNNTHYQLGISGSNNSMVPVPVEMKGVLLGKAISTVAAGMNSSLALCTDGSLVAWGYNDAGQFGNGTTGTGGSPALVNRTGVLAGKAVAAIAVGRSHCLALCSDGTLASWGDNSHGQLGDGNPLSVRTVPVLVDVSGVLAGKRVVAIAAGDQHNVVLCADGTLAGWGDNAYGEVGDGTSTLTNVPVLVNRAGVLAGKTVVALMAGADHSLVRCADGTLAAWGRNSYGELGNNSTTSSPLPVPVNLSGALAGKTVTDLLGGGFHSLSICTDGTLAAWGFNMFGQLGNNATTDSLLPVLVNRSGVLAGKTVVALCPGSSHSTAVASDGTVAAWGYNLNGQLGNNSTANSSVPILVNTGALIAGERIISLYSGTMADHGFARVASPLPSAASLAAAAITGTAAVLRGTANANGNTTAVSFEYGLDTAYGTTVTARPP